MDSIYSSIDSCVLLRIALQDNVEQLRAVTRMLLNGGIYIVDDIAVMETVYVLTKDGMRRAKISRLVQEILRNPVFRYNKQFFVRVFKRYESHPSLSFDDCCLVERTLDNGYAPLWTLDKKLTNQTEVAEMIKDENEKI